MFGATRVNLEPTLASEQKNLILATLAPLSQQPATMTWSPFFPPSPTIAPTGFLTVATAADGSPFSESSHALF